MLLLLLLIVLFWSVALFDATKGLRTIKDIHTMNESTSTVCVSVIIAAKDEERAIRQTIESLANQTYKFVEIIAVNDRSEDETGKIMNQLANHYPNVKAINIDELPGNWLGKNHALYLGAALAHGDLLLFTDGDITFSRHALSRAVAYMEQENAEHLTVAPNLIAKTMSLRAFITYFMFGFGFYKRPWTANLDRYSKGGMGIGAFNLIKRSTYNKIGTHRSMSLRPDDDLYLGQRVKAYGLTQRLATGMDDLHVEWYPTLKEAIKGLEKNTFAGLHYSILMSFIAIVGTFVSQILPFLTLFTGTNLVQYISLVAVILMCTLYGVTTKRLTSFSIGYTVLLPYTALIFIYTIIRAVYLTVRNGGIVWRGTFYSIKDLKKHTEKESES